jgi:hypothetical protein
MTEILPLYKNAFFLHSFLDENIGSEKGNDQILTIDDFLKYSPEPYITKFRSSVKIYQDRLAKFIDAILLKDIKIDNSTYGVRINSIEYVNRSNYKYILADEKETPDEITN